MKVHIHHPRTRTNLPTHELAARRRRAAANLPLARKPDRPSPPPRGRKTIDTRFSNI